MKQLTLASKPVETLSSTLKIIGINSFLRITIYVFGSLTVSGCASSAL